MTRWPVVTEPIGWMAALGNDTLDGGTGNDVLLAAG